MKMLTSELAKELGVDPSVVSKMRTIYREEAGLSEQPELEGETLRILREAHTVKLGSKNMTYRQAIRQVLGLTTEPLTAEQAGQLGIQLKQNELRIEKLEKIIESQNALLLSTSSGVNQLVTHLRFVEEGIDREMSKSQAKVKQMDSLSPVTRLEGVHQRTGEGASLKQMNSAEEDKPMEWDQSGALGNL